MRNNPTPCRLMSLSEAISSWGLSDEAAEKLRAWLTHEDQGYQLDAPADEGLQRVTDKNLWQAGLTQLSQRNLILAKLSHAGRLIAFKSTFFKVHLPQLQLWLSGLHSGLLSTYVLPTIGQKLIQIVFCSRCLLFPELL